MPPIAPGGLPGELGVEALGAHERTVGRSEIASNAPAEMRWPRRAGLASIEMDESGMDHLLVQVDRGLGEQLLDAADESGVRPAASVRGSDLLTLGAIAIAIAGTSADVITLIVERHRIVDFAGSFLRRAMGSARAEGSERLSAEISTPTMKLAVTLDGTGDELAEVLRKLAELTEDRPSS